MKFLSKFVKISFVSYYFNIASIFLLATPVPEPASTTVGDISRYVLVKMIYPLLYKYKVCRYFLSTSICEGIQLSRLSQLPLPVVGRVVLFMKHQS